MAHTSYPPDLPVPTDDGACNHLTNQSLPSISLPPSSSPSTPVPLSQLPSTTVIFCYPRTAAPHETVPDEWNAIPGARGCTPQACSFRDNLSELKALGVQRVYGISTQTSEYQREVQERLGLEYELLSDHDLKFQSAMRLPVFEWEGQVLLKRMAMVVDGGHVVKWFYPVFPPEKSVQDVIGYLKERNAS